ncbi:hypothetical protein L6164_004608 [Bauhinia variegata]|uniref:Uncharacterized protein n=1 Tax=Bauhinia variegata TaxID=167791 RepID=A0ACB9Q710_BAUVA|nr:hypothetical protein L6164_004608 [Bauhinia variegata]
MKEKGKKVPGRGKTKETARQGRRASCDLREQDFGELRERNKRGRYKERNSRLRERERGCYRKMESRFKRSEVHARRGSVRSVDQSGLSSEGVNCDFGKCVALRAEE